MKRETALRHAREIAAILKARAGIFSTPHCIMGVVKVRRAWVFGSTVKGKDHPNDLDVLLDYVVRDRTKTMPCDGKKVPHAYREPRHSFFAVRDARQMMLTELRRGRKRISLHQLEIDGEIATPRVMIYPRNDLKQG